MRPSGELPVDFQRLFESARALLLVLDPTLHIVAVSNAYLAATMTNRNGILGRHLFDVFPDNPDDPAATGVGNLRASLERVIRTGRLDAMAVQKYDVRRPESEGGGFEVRYWSPVNAPVFDDSGRLTWVVHEVADVTEFVELRAAGARAEELNDALRERTAGMEAEIVARGRELQHANAELRTARDELERRVEERTAKLRETEGQLRHAQRMEAVGRLAGGVAHDFNNLLSVILSYTELMKEELPAADARREDLEQISQAATRAAALTAQLLAFSRQQVLQPRVIDVDEVVTAMEKLLRRLLGEDIELARVLGSNGAPVWADPGQIEQVITNLAVNARDAMPRGGKLTLETGLVHLDAEYAAAHVGAQVGPHVMLALTDTGTGMTKEVRSRIFEPFYTTKELGKGTGLGLSTVYGIVKQTGGNVWVYSEVGQGTTFKVYLPVAAGRAVATPVVKPEPQPRNGSETVLLVEDDDLVRAAATTILRSNGYTVLVAGRADEALELLRGHPGHIHLLLTDVVMPGMSGRELADEGLRLRPTLRVLYMSGYTDDTVVRHGVLSANLAFLQKPFTPQVVARRVREVLDA